MDRDRRQSPRQPADPQVRCELVLGDTVKIGPCAVHNISAGGFRLIVDLLVPADLRGVARFTVLIDQFYCQLSFRVVYCYEVPGAGYVLGAAFLRILTPDELERLWRDHP
jgi:PilZ domain